MSVQHRDGIHFAVGPHVVADPRRAHGDVTVVSHAHSDHVPRTADRRVVCSDATAAIVAARTGRDLDHVTGTEAVRLVPAGHVIGSRAAVIDGADGRTYCYTGDVSTRDRGYLAGFDPTAVAADELVVETTYGDPRYRFPPQDELEAAIRDWLTDTADRPRLLFGYSFGRAQKLQHLVREHTGRLPRVTETVAAVNEAISAATELAFDAPTIERGDRLEPGEIAVLPSGLSRDEWVTDLAERDGALRAGFSGWAIEESYRYRGGYDVAFPLTDHCDFEELLALVRTIDPDRVYTTHGFAEPFAVTLQREHGYDARPLLRDQTTLSTFG